MSKTLNYFTHRIPFKLKDKRKITKWLTGVIESFGKIAGSINIIFVGDKYLRNINKIYLGETKFTDTISFPLSEEENIVSGDIYISVERIKDNAKRYGTTSKNELYRVMVHSVLHLVGFSDLTKRQKRVMRTSEDKFLRQIAKV
jgi:rRNA maturation RNase YbeY